MTDDLRERLTDDQERALIDLAQQTLRDGETGMSSGECNRAGWHVGQAITAAVERILAQRLADAQAEGETVTEWAVRVGPMIHGFASEDEARLYVSPETPLLRRTVGPWVPVEGGDGK